jgi:glycosyltransferase involved in cell wall biosynthesis
MKICLVTAFPPSHGGLSEYGFHVARELQRNQFISLSVLADELDSAQPEPDGFSVTRCWRFDDPKSPARLLKVIRTLDPDVVWFNLIFSTFGHNPLAAFCGLTLPLLSRLTGCHTHVTLHQLMDAVDLADAGIRYPRVYRAAGIVATRMLLMSNSVSVLMPTYRRTLLEKYGSQNVHVRAHGVFSQRPQYPDFSQRGTPDHRILAFGKWGTYKRLEPILEAFPQVVEKIPNAKLVIAGGDHPRTPGYVSSVAERFSGDSRITFTGYAPEEAIPELFRNASVAVMPYSSATGSSGIAHFACAYGVPIVCADIADFREMARDENLAIDFYEPGNAEDFAARLIRLLESPQQQRAMAEQNFSVALRMTMPQIIHQYLHHFDRERRTRTLRRMAKLRTWPRWIPWKFLVGRTMGTSSNWSDRPAFHDLLDDRNAMSGKPQVLAENGKAAQETTSQGKASEVAKV